MVDDFGGGNAIALSAVLSSEPLCLKGVLALNKNINSHKLNPINFP